MPVIEVSHLTKEYRLGAIHGIKQGANESLREFHAKNPDWSLSWNGYCVLRMMPYNHRIMTSIYGDMK